MVKLNIDDAETQLEISCWTAISDIKTFFFDYYRFPANAANIYYLYVLILKNYLIRATALNVLSPINMNTGW